MEKSREKPERDKKLSSELPGLRAALPMLFHVMACVEQDSISMAHGAAGPRPRALRLQPEGRGDQGLATCSPSPYASWGALL